MPKLVHKTKIERQKTYNYTERHDRLQKNVGSKLYKSKSELMRDSGYKDVNGTNNVASISNLIRETGEHVKSLDKLLKIRDNSKIERNIIDTAKIVLDIAGAFKEVPEKVENININKDVNPTTEEIAELNAAIAEYKKAEIPSE